MLSVQTSEKPCVLDFSYFVTKWLQKVENPSTFLKSEGSDPSPLLTCHAQGLSVQVGLLNYRLGLAIVSCGAHKCCP